MSHSLPPAGRYSPRIAHIPMPAEILRLPIEARWRMPLPWFCQQDPPDFRVVRPEAFGVAHRQKRCWITGERRFEKRLAFVVGPMCVLSRTSAEPPSRPEPARYAAKACPFLANPNMKRNERDLPEGAEFPGGIAITRNPGAVAVLITDSYSLFRVPGGGQLVTMGEPLTIEWYSRGRPATREEVLQSVASGLPILRAAAEKDGAEGLAELQERVVWLERWLPPVSGRAA